MELEYLKENCERLIGSGNEEQDEYLLQSYGPESCVI